MPKNIKNIMVNPKNKFDYSRSAFPFSVCHGTNMQTGLIYPVSVLHCMPGDTLPKKFGFVLQSAPLLGPSVDNIYIDIIGAWCPTRLVMEDHDQWLGNSDRYAWTLNQTVGLPRITNLQLSGFDRTVSGQNYRAIVSKTYLAEHYLAPHIGCRWADEDPDPTVSHVLNLPTLCGSSSRFGKGLSVIPSRVYDLIWNRIFRNQNIQDPILFSKQSGTDLSLDVLNYQEGLGKLHRANRLKNFLNTAWLSPSIQTVSIAGLDSFFPVITRSNEVPGVNLGVNPLSFRSTSGAMITSDYLLGLHNGETGVGTSGSYGHSVYVGPTNLWADLHNLTVNSLYYSIMLQRYFNKASEGRRPVEFYKEFFGVNKSNAVYDDPELIFQKRYNVNISRVIATGNSTDGSGNLQGLGTQGAFSFTSVGDYMPEFTATEYGIFMIFAVIRTQESYSGGCDRHLSDEFLLGTYLPVFDHIGKDYIDLLEVSTEFTGKTDVFGYQDAWYQDRYFISHNVGIFSPGEPLDYMTLARDLNNGVIYTVSSDFISQGPGEVDRMLQLPVYYTQPNKVDNGKLISDEDGELYNLDRYQWVINFCHAGEIVRTMSKDSSQLDFSTRV